MKKFFLLLIALLVCGTAFAELKPEDESYLLLMIAERKAQAKKESLVLAKTSERTNAMLSTNQTYDVQILNASTELTNAKTAVDTASK